jgi:hypothetical protein
MILDYKSFLESNNINNDGVFDNFVNKMKKIHEFGIYLNVLRQENVVKENQNRIEPIMNIFRRRMKHITGINYKDSVFSLSRVSKIIKNGFIYTDKIGDVEMLRGMHNSFNSLVQKSNSKRHKSVEEIGEVIEIEILEDLPYIMKLNDIIRYYQIEQDGSLSTMYLIKIVWNYNNEEINDVRESIKGMDDILSMYGLKINKVLLNSTAKYDTVGDVDIYDGVSLFIKEK